MKVCITPKKWMALILCTLIFNITHAQFTAGNLALLRADVATANNTTATIVQINTNTAAQAAITTTAIDGTSANALRMSGSATSTGYMARTADKSLLCFTGHNTTNTTANVNTILPRGVGTLNSSATFNLATTYTGSNNNQTRCATSLNNTNFYIVDQAGINTNASTSSSPTGNYRAVKTFGGVVYLGSAAAGIQVSTLSAISGGTVTGLSGLTTNSAFADFYLISSGSNGTAFDILYTTSNTSATAGTIAKYSLVSGTWVANGTYTTSFGGFGVVAEKAGTGANIFTTTGNGGTAVNSIIKMSDAAGYNTTIAITTASNVNLHTAATGTTYKGIEFVPEASTLPTVTLTANTNAGTEAGTTVITLTATASSTLTSNQTVNLAVSGTGITGGDYTLSSTTITIPSGSTTGTATFTVVDDLQVEGTETATVALNTPSAGIALGSPSSQNITITDNDVASATVNLSVSTNVGSEENMTTITVTATASAAVVGNQTVSLTITGAGINALDYFSPNTITILNGNTTGSVTFKVRTDAELEGTETAILTISNPSAGILLGTTLVQNIAIEDFTCQPLIRKSTATSTNGAEISAFDPASARLYTVAGPAMEFYTISNTGALSAPTNVPFGFTSAGNTILPNSVAIKNGIVAVAYGIVNTTSTQQQNGVVAFYTAATGAFMNSVQVGYLPDMIIFNPAGTKVLTANEGEPNSYGVITGPTQSFDPEGSVSIIDIAGGVAAATVTTAGFTNFNSQIASLRAAGVRIYGPGATVAQDVEPEYISFSADGNTAYVVLQENNAIAVLDVNASNFTNILPLGLKDHSLVGNGLDPSDQDGAINGGINIATWPIKGMYMPDAMASYTVGGITYHITANEGDSRAYTGYSEEVRVADATYILDPTIFPNATTLKINTNLGRLQLTNATGNTDGADGDFEEIHALGARSFSIWNSSFTRIYDSGDQLEQITAAQSPAIFNSDGTTASFNGRSDNKGPEPEAVAIGKVGGISYAFIGSERTGDIFVYDVTNPTAPIFKQYVDYSTDLGVEGLMFIPANESPTGKPLIVTSAEVSRTVSVYEFNLVANTLAPTFTNVTAQQDSLTDYGNCTSLIATVKQIPNNANSIAGNVTSKVWIDATQNITFVKRHYEITPTANATTAEARVTLYFTQQNFDDFNAVNVVQLPTGPTDNAGKANLLVEKRLGTSSDNSGLPNTYPGSFININPADADIIWNATFIRWEVTFNVVGFSGFWIKTQPTALPVKWLNVTAILLNTKQARITWQVQELNIQKYIVEKSDDGLAFVAFIKTLSIGDGKNTYSVDDAAMNNTTTFYRIKQIGNDGSVSYSRIVKLEVTNKNKITLYPTPAQNEVFVNVPLTLINTNATLFNKLGQQVEAVRLNNITNIIGLQNLTAGMYYIKFANGETLQFVKK